MGLKFELSYYVFAHVNVSRGKIKEMIIGVKTLQTWGEKPFIKLCFLYLPLYININMVGRTTAAAAKQ